jgi:hypothetical protein
VTFGAGAASTSSGLGSGSASTIGADFFASVFRLVAMGMDQEEATRSVVISKL